jgi:hypothetical protein
MCTNKMNKSLVVLNSDEGGPDTGQLRLRMEFLLTLTSLHSEYTVRGLSRVSIILGSSACVICGVWFVKVMC